MSHYQAHPDFYNQPVLLDEEYRKDPAAFISNFFSDYNLSELRGLQAEILELCLTCGNAPFDDPGKRADVNLYHKNVVMLFEAAFLVMKNSR